MGRRTRLPNGERSELRCPVADRDQGVSERNFTTEPFELKTNTLTTLIQAPPTPPRTRGRALAAGTARSSAPARTPQRSRRFLSGRLPKAALIAPPDALFAPKSLRHKGKAGQAARMRHPTRGRATTRKAPVLARGRGSGSRVRG